MPPWLWLVDFLGVIIVGLLLLAGWLVARRRIVIRRSGAAFDMSVTQRARGEGGWMLGFATYRGAELLWYRTFSVLPRPKFRFERADLSVGQRRNPDISEAPALPAGHVVVPTENPYNVTGFALTSGALTGLLSWLESSPPGERVNNVV